MSSTLNNNEQKTPLSVSLQKLGAAKAKDATQALGKELPCTVVAVVSAGIVTVNFEVATAPFVLPQVTMAVAKSPYVNEPIQVGDKGVAMAASVRLGGLTGLGGGVPSLQDTVGNLSALTFHPSGDTSQTALDPTCLELFGNILCKPGSLSFFAQPAISRKTVTGALSAVTDTNAKAVLTSLIQALAAYGLIENGTT